jgi:hypothetical protein
MRYSYADPVWVLLWAGYEDAYKAVLPKYEQFTNRGGAISPIGLYYAWQRGDSEAFWQLAKSPQRGLWTRLAAGQDALPLVTKSVYTAHEWMAGERPMLTARMGYLAWELACWDEQYGMTKVLGTLKRLLDWAFNSALLVDQWKSVRLWDGAWRASNEKGARLVPEIGPLVAPAYAYLAKATGEGKWLNMADAQIEGALRAGDFSSMRNWNQLMLLLGWYYEWRQGYVERQQDRARESTSSSHLGGHAG